MALDYFDSRVLTGVINKRPPQWGLFTDLFFSAAAPSPTDKFELQIKSRGNELLPFVREAESGKILDGGEGEVVMAIAPRIRVKRPYRATEVLKNPMGYNPYDLVADPVERAIVDDMDATRKNVDTTIEWMCSQIVTTGKITVSDIVGGKARKIYDIDERMPAAHKITLNQADSKWSSANSKIIEMVEDWSIAIQEESGNAPTDLVLGKNAFSAFLRHADVKGMLDIKNVDLGELSLRAGNKFKGMWNGLRIWLYAATVIGYDGKPISLMPADSVVLGAKDVDSKIMWGLPLDRKCLGATQYFTKTYEQEDPSATWVLTESRPMPWAQRPGSFVCAKVV